MNKVGAQICQGNSAFLKEPLITTGKSKQSSYDLSMSISHSYSEDFVYAVITSCKNITNVEYSISFENPGSYRRRHFSCQDIGLLETYFWLVCLFGLVTYKILVPSYKRLKWEEATTGASSRAIMTGGLSGSTAGVQAGIQPGLPGIQSAPHLAPHLGTLGLGSAMLSGDLIWSLLITVMSGVSIICQFVHLFVYSQDGMGLRALSYLGELLETGAGCLLIGQCLPPQVASLAAAYSTLFFLWTQITYKNKYVQRLRTGQGLGDFGLSVYSPLFGTRLGVFTVLIRAGLGASLMLQKRHDLLRLAYFLTPILLVLSPIKWKHCEVTFMALSLITSPIYQLVTRSGQVTNQTSKDTVFIEESAPVLYETI
ncbi:putative transmembrane protein [Gregarina niphandrodes]|uniref:Transmembrane protein n=1 Tax=Gregarina niphandrodes TaxID=110365 RepID=A0A023B2C6_GRENI|nr:putative transmembrane protein [Gregarina niphandrodes]EZG51728.1 putative transmembrane protein [Gregarina niphandrodes]|eukprot:XP_011131920.1 putative transmembrane protein [Gregarina niphandrodes]